MPRYIDAERMPNDAFWEGLTDTEKAKVISWMLQAPAADVAPVVHGEWLPVSDDDQDEGEYYCSVCNAEEFFPNNAPFTPFCWHCGAKMDGGRP